MIEVIGIPPVVSPIPFTGVQINLPLKDAAQLEAVLGGISYRSKNRSPTAPLYKELNIFFRSLQDVGVDRRTIPYFKVEWSITAHTQDPHPIITKITDITGERWF
jgi:hypothetical protein